MKLLKAVSVYTLANIVNSGISFLLLPVFTRYLSPTDFGFLSLASVITSLISPFIHLSVHGGFQVEFHKLKKTELPHYLSSALSNSVLSTILLTLLIVLLGPLLSRWISYPYLWLLIIPPLALLQVIPNLIASVFQIKNQPVNHTKYVLSMAIVNLLLGLLFVAVLNWSWEGRIIGWLLTYTLFSTIGLFILTRQTLLSRKPTRQHSRSALAFGLPLIPHLISSIVIDASDRLFIAKMVSVEQLGIYNVGYQVGMIMSIIQHSLVLAYTPILFENLKIGKATNKQKMVRITHLLVLIMIGSLVLLTLFTPLFFDIFIHDRFTGGQQFVFWVGLGYLFLGMYKMVTGYIFYLKKTKILGYLSVVNITLNLVLNYILITKFGALGAAYATVCSYFILFLIVSIISYRLYPMPWFSIKSLFQTKDEKPPDSNTSH